MILALKLALLALMLVIIVDDLRNYRIRNVNVGIALGLTLTLLWLSTTPSTLLFHFALAGVAVPVLLLAYARNAIGGGDAKLLSVAFFFTGPGGSFLFALAMLALTLLYWLAASLDLAPSQRLDGRLKIPFGPGIAGAWIVSILASGMP